MNISDFIIILSYMVFLSYSPGPNNILCSINGTKYLENAGYKNIKNIYSDGYKRGIFLNIELSILDLMVHKTGGIRTILLEKNENQKY